MTTPKTAIRGFGRRIRSASAALAMAVLSLQVAAAPALAQADACASLREELAQLNREIGKLMLDYPGTHAVIGLCGNTAVKAEDAASGAMIFGACALLGCNLAGFDNCKEVAGRWFALMMRKFELDRRIQENGCP